MNEMNAKYKIGDVFVKRGERDSCPFQIKTITYMPAEPVYTLESIYFKHEIEFGESALEELYIKTYPK